MLVQVDGCSRFDSKSIPKEPRSANDQVCLAGWKRRIGARIAECGRRFGAKDIGPWDSDEDGLDVVKTVGSLSKNAKSEIDLGRGDSLKHGIWNRGNKGSGSPLDAATFPPPLRAHWK